MQYKNCEKTSTSVTVHRIKTIKAKIKNPKMLSFIQLYLFHLLILIVNCDSLIVKTGSGRVQGLVLTTLLNNEKYYAFRGIPYAKPPIAKLRFKVQLMSSKQ